MRRQKLLLSLLASLPLAFASCGGGQSNTNGAAAVTTPPAATPQAAPKPQEVTATVEEAKLDAGGAGEATVRLDILQGYHTHANPATDRFYIATELSAEPLEGITPGKPVYPPGVQRKLGFEKKPLALYEGSVRIKLPLRADKNAPKGRHTLRAKIRVQPCNDEACLPPRYIDAPIPVTIN
ncbi:MAG: protein-disulfide reductase DsbD domain-containing protein [Pyrinomonadaceae bacterium]